jgi:hypothetical protein
MPGWDRTTLQAVVVSSQPLRIRANMSRMVTIDV